MAARLLKTTIYMGLSLDGFIARKDDRLDFLDDPTAADVDAEATGFSAFFATVDVVVMGRKTFDVVCGFGRERWLYGRTPVVVLSHGLDPARVPAWVPDTVSVRHGTPADVLTELASRGAKHVYVDGGSTARSFLAAGLIDQLVITHVPVLIGEGISVWGPLPADIRLRLVDSRVGPGGFVQSTYAVQHVAG
ncbi:MAG: dihydrofolate reductase family protein [Deltaproteobacteria bacterium]|nr:dihydrofolate reductase family protein [Deltaproteobacteria bacterium]